MREQPRAGLKIDPRADDVQTSVDVDGFAVDGLYKVFVYQF